MNNDLEKYVKEIRLAAPEHELLRLKFGYECALRIVHLLEAPEVIECLKVFGRYIQNHGDESALHALQVRASQLANQHRGSKSIDGCGHAAVSGSYAVANAIKGRALEAASYSAYALVYAQGGYAAVAEKEAFEQEFLWQTSALRKMYAEIPAVSNGE